MSLAMRAMSAVMFKVSRSKYDFNRTEQLVRENAVRVGWDVPWRFELQQHYVESGFADMTKAVNVYLCNMLRHDVPGVLLTFAFLALIPFPLILIMGVMLLIIWHYHKRDILAGTRQTRR